MAKGKPQDESTKVDEPKTQSTAITTFDPFAAQAVHAPHIPPEDASMPFLRLLQALSPEATEGHEKQLEGARPSMFLQTVSKELFDTKKGRLIVIPVFTKKTAIEWKLRENGGGFVREWPWNKEVLDTHTVYEKKRGNVILPSGAEQGLTPGNQLQETATIYLFIYNESTQQVEEAVFPLTGTALGSWREFNSLVRGKHARRVNPSTQEEVVMPFYFQSYELSVALKKNDQGSWFSPVFRYHLPLMPTATDSAETKSAGYLPGGESIFKAAYTAAEELRTGLKKIDMAKMDAQDGDAREGSASVVDDGTKDLPF